MGITYKKKVIPVLFEISNLYYKNIKK